MSSGYIRSDGSFEPLAVEVPVEQKPSEESVCGRAALQSLSDIPKVEEPEEGEI